MQAFFAAHPNSAAFRQWAQQHQPSSSFASTTFNSINAFYLVNTAGQRQAVRWSVVPQAVDGLGASAPPGADFLAQDLTQRLAAFWHLCKPRVNSLIVFTAMIGMFLASPAFPPLGLFLAASVGIALVAGARLHCRLQIGRAPV